MLCSEEPDTDVMHMMVKYDVETVIGYIDTIGFQYVRYTPRDSIEFENNSLMEDVICQIERPLLKILLSKTNWNQQKTARILGINRNTLRKKIELLNLKNNTKITL